MAPRSAVSSASLLLLGTETPPRDLDSARLKTAYRKMALLTHPDTRLRHGLPDFLHVKQAFEELGRYLQRVEEGAARQGSRQAARPAPRSAHRPAPAAAQAGARGPGGKGPGSKGPASKGPASKASGGSRDGRPRQQKRPAGPATATRAAPGAAPGTGGWYWKGKIPDRPLRLGEFLFYSGVIPWDVLIKAIVEQKGARPNLGQLACRLGLVSREDLLAVLEQRSRGERLGEAFVRFGVLGRSTVDRLLSEQLMLQRPLGWHLVRMGGLPHAEIPAVLGRLWRHNSTTAR